MTQRPFGFTADERETQETRITGGGTRTPPRTPSPVERPLQAVQGQMRQDTVQKASNRIAFHFGQRYPDFAWASAVPVLAEKFIETVGSNPQALAALDNDVNALWALTDQDIADRIESGEPFSELDPILESITEVLWEVGAKEESLRWIQQRQDGIRGQFEQLTGSEQARLLREVEGFDKEGRKLGSVTQIFDSPGAWVYDPDANLLAVTVGENTVGFTPTQDFDPESSLDVITEFVRATFERPDELVGSLEGPGIISKALEVAHSWGQWVDSNPTAARTIDNLVQTFKAASPLSVFSTGEYVDWMTGNGPHPAAREGPIARHQQAIDEELGQVNVEAYRQASTLRFPEELIVAQMGLDITRLFEESGQTPPDDPLSLAADLVEENRDQLLDTWQSLNQDELVDELRAQLESESALGRGVESVLGGTLNVFNTWENVTQWLGIQVMVRSGLAPAIRAITDDEEDTPATVFQKAWEGRFEDLGDDPNVADYFGLEGSLADAALLAVGIGFDPLNFFFPGAKGQAKLFQQAMTQPAKYGHHYLANPAVRRITEGIAKGGDDGIRKLMFLEFGPGSDDFIKRLSALVDDPNATRQQVEDVLMDAMENGTFLGAGPNRAVRMGTSQGIGRMAESLSAGKLTDDQAEWIFDMTSEMGRSRVFRLGENKGLDEFADLALQLHGSNPEKAREWWMRALDASSPATTSSQKGVLAAQKQAADKTIRAMQARKRELLGVRDPAQMRANRDLLERSLGALDDVSLGPADDELARRFRNGIARTSEQSSQLKDQVRRFLAGEDIGDQAAKRVQAGLRWWDEAAEPVDGLRRTTNTAESAEIANLSPGDTFDIPFANAERGEGFAAQARGDNWTIEFAPGTRAAENDLNQIPLRSGEVEDELFVSGRFQVDEIDEATRTVKLSESGSLIEGKLGAGGLADPIADAPPVAPDLPQAFHGSAAPLPDSLGALGEGGELSRNLFGPGLYTSSDPGVGRSYGRVRAREETRGGLASLRWTDDTPPNLLDMEAPASGEFLRALGKTLDQFDEALDIPLEDFTRLDQIRRGVDEVTASEAYGLLQRSMFGFESEFVDDVLLAFNQNLADEGIDALRYQGGVRTGGREHEAFVWLKPEKLEVNRIPDVPTKAGLRSDMEDLLARTNAEIDRVDDHLRTIRTEMAKANKEIAKIARLEGDFMAQANDARIGLAQTLLEMYEEYAVDITSRWGDELIPIIEGRVNDLAPNVPVRDWSKVTGAPRSGRYGLPLSGEATNLPSISVTDGFALDSVGNMDKALSQGLSAIGAFPKIQQLSLPASPYELVLFRRIAGNPNMVAKWTNYVRTRALSNITRKMRTLFGINLLLNGITPIKTTVDETVRFFSLTGALGRTMKATAAGTPGVQALQRKLAQIPGFKQLMTDAGEFVTNPYSLEHMRHMDGVLGNSSYTWIDSKTPGITGEDFRNAAERWVNGTLAESPVFKAYARTTNFNASQGALDALTVPEEFVRWWDEEGQFLAKTHELVMGSGAKEAVNANFAYRTLHNTFNNWIRTNVKSGAQNKMRRRLLELGKGNALPLDVVDDADLLMRINKIPAPRPNTQKGWFQELTGINFGTRQAFETAFGRPSARRAGVFHEKYFDEAADIYAKRFGGVYENGKIQGRPGGRILTAEMLASHSDLPLEVAQQKILLGSSDPIVRDVLAKTGLRTGSQLEAQAAAYASRRADDLMYRYTAGSLVGQGVESGLMYPYARAQMDFVEWWARHLTTPQQIGLNVPFTPLASTIGAELTPYQLPLNLRAWSKYGHLTSTSNNDHEDTIIDNTLGKLTFFPLRFDDEFMMDVLPQPGPVPGWMFDLAIENNLLDEEAQDTILAAFPTLAFDQSTGDPAGDLFDALFPQSRRSLRGLAVSSVRSIAAYLGSNIDESEDFLGKVYQFLSDNSVPRGTSDAIVAAYSDWLNENAFTGSSPGSPEWLEATDILALEAALQVNNQDGIEALKSRSPLAMFENTTSQEARDLKAYEGLFDDFIWNELLAWDVLATNELFEVDGQPRIRAVYEKWQNGDADRSDVEFLGDSLHRIYNASRDVEIFPGFTLMDAIHLNSPGIAPNRISKQEWAGGAITTPEAREFFTEHVDPETSRLQNIPPGQEGLDLINKARDRGWITTRSPDGPDGWMRDAHEVLYQSAKNAIDAAWYIGTVGFKVVDGKRVNEGRDWTGQSTKAFDQATVTTGNELQLLLSPLGLDIQPGTRMTGAEYFSLLSELRDQYRIDFNGGQLMDGPVGDSLARGSEFSKGLRKAIQEAGKTQAQNDITSVRDWPEELKEAVREDLRTAISLGDLTLNDYKSDWQNLFGELDYQPPVPPSIDELGQTEGTAGLTFSPSQFRAGEAAVVDGDTLSILLEDGPTRIRLFGINAPEVGQAGYVEATNNLLDVLNAAEKDISIGFFNINTFGLTQRTSPDDQRLIGWLYVDGVPIYDPSVFTADNPRGVGVGGNVVDLMSILEAGK